MKMDKKAFVSMALRHGMVLVPRKPTEAMLHAGEGITDFILPDCFDNTVEARRKEIGAAWWAMIEQWEYEVAVEAMTMKKCTCDTTRGEACSLCPTVDTKMMTFEQWKALHVKSDSDHNLKQLPEWMIEESDRIIRKEYDDYVRSYQEKTQ